MAWFFIVTLSFFLFVNKTYFIEINAPTESRFFGGYKFIISWNKEAKKCLIFLSMPYSLNRVSTVLTIWMLLTFMIFSWPFLFKLPDILLIFLATVHALKSQKRKIFSSLDMYYPTSFLFARVIKLCDLKKPWKSTKLSLFILKK